jgi:hypothetical protein
MYDFLQVMGSRIENILPLFLYRFQAPLSLPILSATLDGHNIQNLNQYRTQTGFGNLTVVEDNIFNNVPGTFNSSNADGFFVFLEPPSPGNHELRLTTSVLNPTTPSYNYAAEVTYHLTVK